MHTGSTYKHKIKHTLVFLPLLSGLQVLRILILVPGLEALKENKLMITKLLGRCKWFQRIDLEKNVKNQS